MMVGRGRDADLRPLAARLGCPVEVTVLDALLSFAASPSDLLCQPLVQVS
jgi:hypothetical protein